MSITDELRVCARTFIGVWVDSVSQTITFTTSDVPPTVDSIRMDSSLLAIADRIDAAHEEAIASVMNDALYHANDKDMADFGWIRLPKDADGEYIHVGDRLEHTNGIFTANDMTISIDGIWRAWDGENGHTVLLAKCRHHKQPTVEDVLDEFASAYDRIGGEDEEHQKYLNLIAEYAAKLREMLAGDAE